MQVAQPDSFSLVSDIVKILACVMLGCFVVACIAFVYRSRDKQ